MSNQSCSKSVSWGSQAGFVWSLIGSAVGFANILSFSAMVYKNGGGAFLIPYCIALFTLGIPFLILEGLIGQKSKSPLVTAYGMAMKQLGKTLGWLAVIACLSIGAFYIVLTGYSVAYTYFAAVDAIPSDTKNFFVGHFLQSTDSITKMGRLSVPIFASTVAVAVVTWFVLVRNVKDGIEKICTIFMPLLAVIMAVFAVTVMFLPGGVEGWYYYLKPDFSKLLDSAIWRDVFGQLFFSLSLGLGIIVGYSRHATQQMNIARSMMYVALGDFAVSFISGAVIFGCLAHMSYVQGVDFSSILTTDSSFEIGFIIFPQILKCFGPLMGQIVGVIFFFCIFIAGITGVFSIVESIAGNVEVEFRMSRKRAVTITIVCLTAFSILFCMGNASHLIDALVPMVVGTNMILGGLGLILAFQYALPAFRKDTIWMNDGRIGFNACCLRYFAPILLGIILVGNLWQEVQAPNVATVVRWVWFALAIAISWTLARRSSKPVPVVA